MSTTAESFNTFVESASLLDLLAMAEFAHVTPATALGWADKRELPGGEALIRLRHFLDAGAYQLDELRELPKPANTLGQLIAFDVLTTEGAKKRLEYASMNDLYRILRGSGLSVERGHILSQLIADNKEELDDAIAAFREQRQPKKLEPLQSSHLSTEILSLSLKNGVELVHTILDLVELQSEDASTALQLTLPERTQISRLNTRLKQVI